MTRPPLKRLLLPLLQIITRTRGQLTFMRHRRGLIALIQSEPDGYREYLNLQLRRTLGKQDAPLQPRTRRLVDRTAELVDLAGRSVLCVGCRNPAELKYFRSKGASPVTGIDLYSASSDILVMDMHHMTFDDDCFDLVYSSHSLEHALDPSQAVKEMLRVARPGSVMVIEVPIAFEPRGADLIDFHNVDTLLAAFLPHISEVLWSEQYLPGPEVVADRTGFACAIFRIEMNG